MNKEEKKNLEEMEKGIDYSAVIARMAGEPLTPEQEESCRKFDTVYDSTHPDRKKR